MDIKTEWQRVRRLMHRLNRKYSTNFTMDYVFGAPSMDRLGNLYRIRTVSDLDNYLTAHRISPPKTPKVEGIEFSNLLQRFQRMPVQFNQDLVKYLTNLRGIVDEPILLEYVRNIYSTMDSSYRYDDNGYNVYAVKAVKELRDNLMEYYANLEDFEKAEDVRQAYLTTMQHWESDFYDYTGE